jgi:hypothetical protein
MKKILFSIFALSFPLSTITSQASDKDLISYIKGSLGYGFAKTIQEITNNTLEPLKNDSKERLKGFEGIISFGQQIHKNISIECFLDYNQNEINKNYSTADDITYKTAHADFNDNANRLDQLIITPSYNIRIIQKINQKESYEESGLAWGTKLNINYNFFKNIYLNTGIGGGYSLKTLDYYAEGQYVFDVTERDFKIKAKSYATAVPFATINLGIDYEVEKGLNIGAEYQCKYQAEKDYKSKGTSKYNKFKFSNNNILQSDMEGTIVKNSIIGSTNNIQHTILANIKLKL